MKLGCCFSGMIKARASGSKVYLYFMKKGRQARHRIPRNSCFSKQKVSQYIQCPSVYNYYGSNCQSTGICTLKCLSIGTPKIINFPFVSDGKLMVFRCSNIQPHYNEAVLCLNFGTPENNEFSIWDKWKIYYFRCPNTWYLSQKYG